MQIDVKCAVITCDDCKTEVECPPSLIVLQDGKYVATATDNDLPDGWSRTRAVVRGEARVTVKCDDC